MAPTDNPVLTTAELAELSARADGTLAPERWAAVDARIAASPQLRELFERERAVVELLHQTSAGERAPDHLRRRIAAMQAGRRTAPRRRAAYQGAFVGALAAFALALVLVLPNGTPGSPSVSQAAALALRGAALPAPPASAADPRHRLAQAVQDVYFPNWASKLGWRAVGQRVDHLDRRAAVTVFYAWRGRRLAYTIVGAPALSQPDRPVMRVHGVDLRTLTVSGRTVVTWRRAGHTCVLSASGVPAATLRALATWTGGRSS